MVKSKVLKRMQAFKKSFEKDVVYYEQVIEEFKKIKKGIEKDIDKLILNHQQQIKSCKESIKICDGDIEFLQEKE